MEMIKVTTWFIVTLFIFGSLKVLVSSMPTSVVESIISRFELHQKLEEENTSISIDGKNIEGEMKLQVINEFNEALFLDKHYFPPQGEGTPIVIDTKKGNKEIRFSLYSYEEHVDVIKQYKKKVVAYRLRSKSLQTPTTLAITEDYA
ncbi:YfmQ family protein [Bacillus thuringiensis]|nr:YfmQ family protein [Bacillus thuringiensis]